MVEIAEAAFRQERAGEGHRFSSYGALGPHDPIQRQRQHLVRMLDGFVVWECFADFGYRSYATSAVIKTVSVD